MFCPKCGNAGQEPDTYCRSCGEFLLDPTGNSYFLNKLLGRATPATQINVNLGISLLTVFACFFLIGFLNGHYDALFERNGETPPAVIYWVYAFLALISVWQIMSLIVGARLRNKLSKQRDTAMADNNGREPAFADRQTLEQLPSPDLDQRIPASVTEEPTKILDPAGSARR